MGKAEGCLILFSATMRMSQCLLRESDFRCVGRGWSGGQYQLSVRGNLLEMDHSTREASWADVTDTRLTHDKSLGNPVVGKMVGRFRFRKRENTHRGTCSVSPWKRTLPCLTRGIFPSINLSPVRQCPWISESPLRVITVTMPPWNTAFIFWLIVRVRNCGWLGFVDWAHTLTKFSAAQNQIRTCLVRVLEYTWPCLGGCIFTQFCQAFMEVKSADLPLEGTKVRISVHANMGGISKMIKFLPEHFLSFSFSVGLLLHGLPQGTVVLLWAKGARNYLNEMVMMAPNMVVCLNIKILMLWERRFVSCNHPRMHGPQPYTIWKRCSD